MVLLLETWISTRGSEEGNRGWSSGKGHAKLQDGFFLRVTLVSTKVGPMREWKGTSTGDTVLLLGYAELRRQETSIVLLQIYKDRQSYDFERPNNYTISVCEIS